MKADPHARLDDVRNAGLGTDRRHPRFFIGFAAVSSRPHREEPQGILGLSPLEVGFLVPPPPFGIPASDPVLRMGGYDRWEEALPGPPPPLHHRMAGLFLTLASYYPARMTLRSTVDSLPRGAVRVRDRHIFRRDQPGGVLVSKARQGTALAPRRIGNLAPEFSRSSCPLPW